MQIWQQTNMLNVEKIYSRSCEIAQLHLHLIFNWMLLFKNSELYEKCLNNKVRNESIWAINKFIFLLVSSLFFISTYTERFT